MLLEGVRNWLGAGFQPGIAERIRRSGPQPATGAAFVPAYAGPAYAEPAYAEPAYAGPWSDGRIALNGQLWGDGFLFPGGEEEALRLARPLGLTAASSLMVVGAGSGGAPCSIAARLGAWVTGFEADPGLAGGAAERCTRARLGGRAQMEMWYPGAPAFRAQSFHHGIALEPLRNGRPEPVLAALADALRPGGQIVIVDVVAGDPFDPADPAVSAWCRLEGRSPDLPSELAVTRMLGRLGFDVRVAEDISPRHIRLAVLGWKRTLMALRQRPTAAEAALLVAEAELWMLRIRMMQEGKVRLLRWHGMLHRRSEVAA